MDIDAEEQTMYEAQPIPQGMGGHASEGSIKYQLEFSEIIDDIKRSLRCEIYTTINGQPCWITPKGIKPLINERGVNSIIANLQSHLTKIFILSDLDQATIEGMTINLGRTTIDDLYYNWENYELKDTAAASIIISLITNAVYATLRKGHGGTYLKFLSKTTHAQEVQHYAEKQAQQTQQNENLLGKIFKKRR